MNRSRTVTALLALLLPLLSAPAWASYPGDPGLSGPPVEPGPRPAPVADHRVLWMLAGVALLAAVLALVWAVAVLWQRHQAASRLLPAA
jgi:hypothetical protein